MGGSADRDLFNFCIRIQRAPEKRVLGFSELEHLYRQVSPSFYV